MYMNSFLTSDNCTNKNQLHSLALTNSINNTTSNNFDQSLANRYFQIDSSTASSSTDNNNNNSSEKQSSLIEMNSNSLVNDDNRLSSNETSYLGAEYNTIDSNASLSVNNVILPPNPTMNIVNNSNISLTNNNSNVNFTLNNSNNNNHLLKPSIFFCFFWPFHMKLLIKYFLLF